MQVGIGLGAAGADGEDAVAAKNGAASEEATELPVGQAEFGATEGILAVGPSGEAVADERGVDGFEEANVRLRVLGEEGGNELRAIPVEESHGVVDGVDELDRQFRRAFP